MIKKIIFVSISLIICAVMAGVFFYIRSFHQLKITLSSTVSSVSVSDSKNNNIKKISSSDTVSLQNGTYIITPSGEHINNSNMVIQINGQDKEVVIDPDFSDEYLDELLVQQLSNINTVINKTYASLMNDFILSDGNLYGKAEWYGTTLTKIVNNSSESNDVYRIILKKEGNSWKIQNIPNIVLTTDIYVDVPQNIIDKINILPGAKNAYRFQRKTIDNDRYYGYND